MWILPDPCVLERRNTGRGILPFSWDEHLASTRGTGHWHGKVKTLWSETTEQSECCLF